MWESTKAVPLLAMFMLCVAVNEAGEFSGEFSGYVYLNKAYDSFLFHDTTSLSRTSTAFFFFIYRTCEAHFSRLRLLSLWRRS